MLRLRAATALLVALATCGGALGSGSSEELSTVLAAAHELREAGSHTAAEQAYRAAAEQFPDRSEPLFFIGLCARASGNDAAALEAYRAALDLNENLAEAHVRAPRLSPRAPTHSRMKCPC